METYVRRCRPALAQRSVARPVSSRSSFQGPRSCEIAFRGTNGRERGSGGRTWGSEVVSPFLAHFYYGPGPALTHPDYHYAPRPHGLSFDGASCGGYNKGIGYGRIALLAFNKWRPSCSAE
ncbi:hypothetical protein KM043_012027 [Ampulex compressa]|nr:hypothetical protein KM043_012027 [Ampulex compressa]